MKKFIVMKANIGAADDFKPWFVGATDTRLDANLLVQKEMDSLIEDIGGKEALANMNISVDYDSMIIQSGDGEYGATWNIEEVNL